MIRLANMVIVGHLLLYVGVFLMFLMFMIIDRRIRSRSRKDPPNIFADAYEHDSAALRLLDDQYYIWFGEYLNDGGGRAIFVHVEKDPDEICHIYGRVFWVKKGSPVFKWESTPESERKLILQSHMLKHPKYPGQI